VVRNFIVNHQRKKSWGKYCSKNCQFNGQRNGKTIACDYCGKEIYRTPKDERKSKSGRFSALGNVIVHGKMKNKRKESNAPNWSTGHAVYRKYSNVLELKRNAPLVV
jgi:hypothetical protein